MATSCCCAIGRSATRTARIGLDAERAQEIVGFPANAGPVHQAAGARQAAHEEVLSYREGVGEGHVLIHRRQAERLCPQRGADIGRNPVEQDASGVALDDAHQHLDQRGLAGAVLAQEGMDLAGRDLQADIRESLHAWESSC